MPLLRRPLRRPLTRSIGAATAAVLLPAVAWTGSGAVAVAPAPAGESPLVLQAPQRVVAYTYDGHVYSSFGLRLVAPTDPVEIRAHRTSYDEPIAATWLAPDGDKALPVEMMSGFRGLDGFLELEVVRDGRTRRISFDTCLNGQAQRIDPAAPARNPYPWGCPWNPYTVGSVMGIEGGYATTPIEEWGRPVRLRPGTYTATVRIRQDYTEFFGITEEDAVEQFRLVVKKEGDGEMFRRRAEQTQPLVPARREPVGAAAAPEGPRPDLRSLPAWDISLNRRGTAIRFAATVWNAGDSPLVVDGFRGEDEKNMTAYQYFFDAAGEQTGYEPVGEMHWHGENHQHWHFEDFARYRLLTEDQAEAVRSGKQSFCLANTDAVDYTVPGADWHPDGTDLSTACGGPEAISVRQVLSSGSGDTYHQFRHGQAFGVKNLPDGVYYIAVEANPELDLVESDIENNDSLRRVELRTNRRGERRLVVAPVGIIEEVSPGWF